MQLGLSLVQNPKQKIGWARLRELLMFLDLIWCRIQMYFGAVWVVWGVKKVLATLFPNIFHIKTKWKVVYVYFKTKIFSRYANILPQMHRTSNIFGHSATTIRGFVVSLNYPILNFKKTVCLKNVWMRYCHLYADIMFISDNIRHKAAWLPGLNKVPPDLQGCLNWSAILAKYFR